jgi:hypothetical protein
MTGDSKDKIQYATAVLMLVSGVVLSFFSFFYYGDIVEGVLWYAGQTMIYAGSIFGVAMYVRGKTGEMKQYVDERLKRKENE